MKVKIVYGCSCAGKSTYVKAKAKETDLIWDYDKILMACTDRRDQLCPGHPMSGLIKNTRKYIIDAAKDHPKCETLWIPTLWISDKLRAEVEGLDVEEIFLDESKETCIERLEKADDRPDKKNWYAVIEQWFKEHGSETKTASKDIRSRRFWNWLQNETNLRELRIDGVIDSAAWFGDEVTPKKFQAELNSGKGDIIVWINSEGGDVFAAVEIYNMLKEYKGKVTVKIDSLAASAASIIAMAGDTIEISPCGMIMIHNPWTQAQGDSQEMKTAAKMLDSVKESIITAYELKTKLPREEISRLMDEESWLPAEQAIKLGFADKIISAGGTAKAQIFSGKKIMNCTSAETALTIRAKINTAQKKSAKKNLRREKLNRLKKIRRQ